MFTFDEAVQTALVGLLIKELDAISEFSREGDFLRIPYEKALAELIGDSCHS